MISGGFTKVTISYGSKGGTYLFDTSLESTDLILSNDV